ncbi:MAG: leucine-rich repeat domain-containing protein [Oleispira sp.]
MFKIILAVMVFSLAACSDNSKKSSSAPAADKVNESLAVSQSSDFGFVVDANLRACLDDSGMTVESVHTLVCSGKGVQSLEGMEQLPALANLNVSHNNLSDITPLANVKGLQVLYATNNSIESVSALTGLPELTAISLRSNKLSDADVFYTLPQLKKLYLQGNAELDLDVSKLAQVIVAI